MNQPLLQRRRVRQALSTRIGASLYNSRPRDIRQVESLGLFKRLIKEVR